MGKGKRLKRLRKSPGKTFAERSSEAFTRNFQKELRNSPIWDELVSNVGEKRALEILGGCKAEVKTDMGEK